ncbi:hypothetical protein Tco_0613802, partial [Tanacetum coccineum]
MMSRESYNSIMMDEVEHKGKNVVEAFMNVPIFVKKNSVVTHFVVMENIDGYRDQDMGDIILGEPFCKASCVEARRFDGLITIHNGSNNVTYQMARSHPRFKHLSNAQCNKIMPLLKDLAEKKSTILVKYLQSRNLERDRRRESNESIEQGIRTSRSNEAVAPEYAVSTGSPSSTTVDQDAPTPSNSPTQQETQTPILSHDVEEDNHDIEVAHMGNDPYFGIPIPEVSSDQS